MEGDDREKRRISDVDEAELSDHFNKKLKLDRSPSSSTNKRRQASQPKKSVPFLTKRKTDEYDAALEIALFEEYRRTKSEAAKGKKTMVRRPPLTLLDLPNEVLSRIISYLQPKAIPVGHSQVSLWLKGGEYRAALISSAETHSLAMANRRLRELALPLMYENLLLYNYPEMARLLRRFIERPDLARTVKTITCSLRLENCDLPSLPYVQDICDVARKRWGTSKKNPSCLYAKLMDWLTNALETMNMAPIVEKEGWTVMFFCILALATRVTTLNMRMDNPAATLTNDQLALPVTRPSPLPSILWRYLVQIDSRVTFPDETMEKLSGNHRFIPPLFPPKGQPIKPGMLEQGPCWPPPMLEKVTVEWDSFYKPSAGQNFFEIFLIPRTNQLHKQQSRNSKTLRPLVGPDTQILEEAMRNPINICGMSGQDRVTSNILLDLIADVPHMRNMVDLNEHIRDLSNLPTNFGKKDDIKRFVNLERHQSFLHFLYDATAPRPYLKVWNKRIDVQLYNFLRTMPWRNGLQEICEMGKLRALTIRFDSRKPCDKDLPNATTPPQTLRRLHVHIFAYQHVAESLRLPLYMNKVNTRETYFHPHDPTGRVVGLERYRRIKHL